MQKSDKLSIQNYTNPTVKSFLYRICHAVFTCTDYVLEIPIRYILHVGFLCTGNYSRLIVDVGWKRDSTWHIWTLHVPLALISFMSIIPLLGHFEHGPIMSIITV